MGLIKDGWEETSIGLTREWPHNVGIHAIISLCGDNTYKVLASHYVAHRGYATGFRSIFEAFFEWDGKKIKNYKIKKGKPMKELSPNNLEAVLKEYEDGR